MRKKFLGCALATALSVLGLVGCGAGDTETVTSADSAAEVQVSDKTETEETDAAQKEITWATWGNEGELKRFEALNEAFMEANPVLLEPIASLKVTVPDKYTGDIMGDLNKRRGRVLGMNPTDHGYQEIVADIPYMELFGYNTDLRSMTGGSGTYSYEFSRYEQAPSDIQEKEIAARASKVEKLDE
mgnify:CR=1 FL=1